MFNRKSNGSNPDLKLPTTKEELFQVLDKYNGVVDIFVQETDRAAAILSASYLETLLEQFLRVHLIQSRVVDEMFQGNGPLASFSARIALCYALGLISEEIYRDLTLIRRIRNHFAHNIEKASFQDPVVQSRCSELALHKNFKEMGAEGDIPKDARTQFLLSVGITAMTITQPMLREWVDHSHKKQDKDQVSTSS